MHAADLIEHYVEEDARHPGPARARLRPSGVDVWALVAQLPAMDGDTSRLAAAYGLSIDAVEAALAYYRRHKRLLDAQIMINAS